ncbi:MAG: AIM24 family protein [Phycisphaeraceae bacterium]|nr:AIM24 family protein [Phycisphaeraceae bacterium]MCW5763093.1 AIM24 family protein [Phycisphaeraceae bacterium]
MSRYSIDDFLADTVQRDLDQGLFELERERILEVNLADMVWMKHGAMIAYRGDIRFEREGIFQRGLAKTLKKTFTGEGARLTKATGRGKLYLADQGKKVTILNLERDAIFINGNDILAFEASLDWDIKLLRKVMAIAAGGLFNVRLEGTGMVALTTHFEPLTLLVEPGSPVFTDPQATVAWSGNLSPEFKTDIQLKTFFGRGSGESVQMRFEGSGFVVVQPFEESLLQSQAGATNASG